MRFILLILLSIIIGDVTAQTSDFIVVKKRNNRTVRTYFPGVTITLETTYGAGVSGTIEAIRHDSVFIKEWVLQMVPTMFGTMKQDTLTFYNVALHYSEIKRIEFNVHESFVYVRNGLIFMIGGGAYMFLNVVNGAYLKDSFGTKKNLRSFFTAAAVAGTGFLLNRLYHHNRTSGKKYRVHYVKMNGSQKQ